jgi:thiazole synthase ThiGH ThiG subunit
VVTETQAGATQALTAGDGGLLLLTNTAADDDLVALQKTPAAFTLTAGKRAFFACKFKVSDAAQSDVAIGMQVIDTTPQRT